MDKLYHGYLCNLKIENYMCNVYVLKEVILFRKKDKYYDVTTNETYDVILMNKEGKLNFHDEGLYFTNIIPYEKFLERNKPNIRKRK